MPSRATRRVEEARKSSLKISWLIGPPVADLVELAHHRRDRQIALPREATIVSAQKERNHLDPGRIGGLDEDDPIGRDLGDVLDRQPPGEQVQGKAR